MKKNVLLSVVGFAVVLVLASCSSRQEATYTVDGATPQERYSVLLTPDSVADAQFRSYKDKSVKEFTLPSKSRPFIAHDLIASVVSPVRIACGDTIYRIRRADEVYTYRVTFSSKTVPDYKVLLRDFIDYGGLVADTAMVPALTLSIVDTQAYRASVAPFLRSTGVNIRYDSLGNWMYYTPMPEGDTRMPMHIFEIVSALRYYWGLPVVPDAGIDMLELLSTGTDFATPGLDADQVQEMLLRKFGMQLSPADREVMVVSLDLK